MLSPAQISQFERQGYLVVEDVLAKDLLDRVRSEYAAVMDNLLAGWGLEALARHPVRDATDRGLQGRL